MKNSTILLISSKR